MPKVAYFSNQFSSKQGHGIARYARELFSAMRKHSDECELIPIAAWSDLESESLSQLKKNSNLEILPMGRRGVAGSWTYLNFPPIEWLSRNKFEIVHAVALGYPIATRKKFITTVHDIGPLTHPEFFSDTPPWLMEKSLKQAVNKASSLVCVSQSTADELNDYVRSKYNVNLQDRISVIHEGVSASFFSPTSFELTDTDFFKEGHPPYFLAVGKISPRKNFKSILQALSAVKDSIPHHLIVVGGNGWDFEQISIMVDELDIRDRVHFQGYVSDDKLKALYKSASTFIYPSLYEGFGLTILEAMASGCPVITSNTSSIPEVASNAASLIDPTSLDELIDAMIRHGSDKVDLNQMKQLGISRAKELSWNKCAHEMLQVYQQVSNE
ncbi:MAG: glycosyltransferase family 4 protein [Bacteroidia bacterium]